MEVHTYGRGRLSQMTDPTGSANYEYDRRGLVRREAKTVEGNAYTTAYAYDPDGNRTSMTYPSGRIVTFVNAIATFLWTARGSECNALTGSEGKRSTSRTTLAVFTNRATSGAV